MHEGLRLFWRVGASLQVNIYGNFSQQVVAVLVLDPDNDESVELLLDWAKVEKSVRKGNLVDFVLGRLAVQRLNGKLSVTMSCLHDDEYPSVVLDREASSGLTIRRQRSVTLDDVQNVRKAFVKEREQLQLERTNANQLSEAVRASLDAFQELANPAVRAPWLHAFHKLSHKASVLQTRAMLSGNLPLQKRLRSPRRAMEAALR